MANLRLNICEDNSLHGVNLNLLSFTCGVSQLSQMEVEFSQRFAKIRIHVERVISLLKNKYTILQGIFAISIKCYKNDS